jgi:hypothetical protein
MVTRTLPVPSKWRIRRDKARYWVKNYAIPYARFKVKTYSREVKGNVYTVFGLVCFSAAGYVHSLFAGLIVTGACWFALELKTRGV